MQLVAVDDVAATVAELATGAPVGGRVELGGPEALGIDAWARRLFAATGDDRTVVGDPHARYFGTELEGGELTPGDGARIGATDFDIWFAGAGAGSPAMTEINVIVTGPEEAYDNEAEFWCANEQIGVTVLHEGRLHLRIDPRADGAPWLADVTSLARALAEAEQRLAAY